MSCRRQQKVLLGQVLIKTMQTHENKFNFLEQFLKAPSATWEKVNSQTSLAKTTSKSKQRKFSPNI